MAYDGARQQVVLFGGSSGNGVAGDTWIWNGTAWTQVFPLNSPSPRASAQMVYDAARQQVVMYGGFQETWVWDGSNWIKKTPLNSPNAVAGFAFAYDPTRSLAVLAGGCAFVTGRGCVSFNETWVWDGSNWTNVTPAPPASNLPVLYGPAMAYDGSSGQIVLFGGTVNGGWFNDTWAWNGSVWTHLNPANPPAARAFHAMSPDPVNNQVVLFGGGINSAVINDTWIWRNSIWTQVFPPTSPPAREAAGFAYDSGRSQFVLFGGNWTGSPDFSDTWVLTLSPLSSAPTLLSFEYSAGFIGPLPAQQLSITSNAGPLGFSVAIVTNPPGGKWFAVAPRNGTTGAKISVTVSGGLRAGSYSGTIILSPTAGPNIPLNIPVTLIVSGCLPPSIITDTEDSAYDKFASSSVSNILLNNNQLTADVTISNNSRWWLGVSPLYSSSGPPFVLPTFVAKSGQGVTTNVARESLVLPCSPKVTSTFPFFDCTPQSTFWTTSFCGTGRIDLTVGITPLSTVATITDLIAPTGLTPSDMGALANQLSTIPDLNQAGTCLQTSSSTSSAVSCAIGALNKLLADPGEMGQTVLIMTEYVSYVTLSLLADRILKLISSPLDLGLLYGQTLVFGPATNHTWSFPVTIQGQ